MNRQQRYELILHQEPPFQHFVFGWEMAAKGCIGMKDLSVETKGWPKDGFYQLMRAYDTRKGLESFWFTRDRFLRKELI